MIMENCPWFNVGIRRDTQPACSSRSLQFGSPASDNLASWMSSWDAWWQTKPQQNTQWRADGPAKSGVGNWRRTSSGSAFWEANPDAGWAQSWQSFGSAPAASSEGDSWQHVRSSAGESWAQPPTTIAADTARAALKDDPWTVADPWSASSPSVATSPPTSDGEQTRQLGTQQLMGPPPDPFSIFGATSKQRRWNAGEPKMI